MSKPTMMERILGLQGPGTIAMTDGAGTDGVADPEPWDTATAEQPTGEYVGTFPIDPNDGRVLVPDDPAVRPVKVERIESHWHQAPSRWTTGTTTIAADAQPFRAMTENPERSDGLITNQSGTETVWVAPDPGSCKALGSSRPLYPGQSYEVSHTAEVWIGPAAGASAGCDVTIDQQYKR